jgi:DUF1009 family protein
VDPSLASQVDVYEEVAVGQLGRLIESLKRHEVHQAILAGKVTKEVLLGPRTAFDSQALSLLSEVREFSVAALLVAIGKRLAREGIELLDSSTFLKESLCPVGVLTSRPPTAEEQEDIQLGIQVARAIAQLDVGQTVIVKGRVVVAVEALEGTDAAIHRAHALAGQGLVVVKTGSPHQDRRIDLPVIGLDTVRTLRESGVSCLAVEAEVTVILERDSLVHAADAAGICLVGVQPPP